MRISAKSNACRKAGYSGAAFKVVTTAAPDAAVDCALAAQYPKNGAGGQQLSATERQLAIHALQGQVADDDQRKKSRGGSRDQTMG